MNVKTTRETLQINEQKGKIIFHGVARADGYSAEHR